MSGTMPGSSIGGVVRPATSAASRPATGQASARLRAPASGRTNRRTAATAPLTTVQVAANTTALLSAPALQLQMRSTGTFALNKTDSGRLSVASTNEPAVRKMETVSLLRDTVPGPKEWISEMHASQKLGVLTFADKLLELNEEKQMIMQQAIDKVHAQARHTRTCDSLASHRRGNTHFMLLCHLTRLHRTSVENGEPTLQTRATP
jgi:hypothetical protein